MANDVDELFGGGDGTPEPRTTPAIVLAVLGVVLGVVGLACLSAPGGVVVLLGLWWIEREHDRIENGYLPEEARPTVQRARSIVFLCLFLVIGLLFLQAFLYCGGYYQMLGDLAFRGELPMGTPSGAPIGPITPPPAPAPAPTPPLPPVPAP